MTSATIRKAYMRLWTAFVDAAGAQNLRAEPGVAPRVSSGKGVTTAEATFFLSGWPYKSVSDRKKVDIAVTVHELFAPDLSTVVKATTRVGYFKREEAAKPHCVRPLLEMHYDFETPVQEAHPVFHAQFGATHWPTETLKALGMVGDIDRDGEGAASPSYSNVRIPTAFVGFVTVLVALAADHLEPRNFRDMMKAAKDKDDGVVGPKCETFLESLLAAQVPHAHHWYDERYVVHLWEDKKAKVFRAAVPVLDERYKDHDRTKLREQVMAKLRVPAKQNRWESRPPG